MRKALIIALVAGLIAGALVGPAAAKKKKAKPVATTMYFHAPSQFGEIDGAQWAADGFAKPPGFLDATEPAAGAPKSQSLGNPALNTQCAGLPLGFPTFQGDFAGTIVGDAKIIANFVSPPGTVTARLWTDTPAFSCNEGYIAPASEVVVDVPAGQNEVEIVFPDLNLPGQSWILLELLGEGTTYEGRLLYDSADAMTRIEFSCIPAAGAKACTP